MILLSINFAHIIIGIIIFLFIIGLLFNEGTTRCQSCGYRGKNKEFIRGRCPMCNSKEF